METLPYIFIVIIAVAGMVPLQSVYKKSLDRERYGYMRRLTATSLLLILSCIWGNADFMVLAGSSLLAVSLGVIRVIRKDAPGWKLFYPLIGLCLWSAGFRISFLNLPSDSYQYFTTFQSMILTMVWFNIIPFLLERLDSTPGLAGHVVLASLALNVLISVFLPSAEGIAFIASLTTFLIFSAFWSCYGNFYRKMGCPSCSFWGILIAGISLMGFTKGVTVTTMSILPIGLFILPMTEISLGAINSAINMNNDIAPPSLYSVFIKRGMTHPASVRIVTLFCCLVGAGIFLIQAYTPTFVKPFLGCFTLGATGIFFVIKVLDIEKSSTIFHKRLWGTRIDSVSKDFVMAKIKNWITHPTSMRYIVTLNALSARRCKLDKDIFRKVVNGADLVIPDGKGLVLAMKLLGMNVVEKISGVDLLKEVCRFSVASKIPVYFLGAKPGVAEKCANKIREEFPGLIVAGFRDGYFNRKLASAEICSSIRESGSKVLFVALGQPEQELWIKEHASELEGIVCIGVGGAFDVLAGKLKRAPQKWQTFGLEWLYRMIQEPRRFKDVGKLTEFVFYTMCTFVSTDD